MAYLGSLERHGQRISGFLRDSSLLSTFLPSTINKCGDDEHTTCGCIFTIVSTHFVHFASDAFRFTGLVIRVIPNLNNTGYLYTNKGPIHIEWEMNRFFDDVTPNMSSHSFYSHENMNRLKLMTRDAHPKHPAGHRPPPFLNKLVQTHAFQEHLKSTFPVSSSTMDPYKNVRYWYTCIDDNVNR